MKILKRLTNPGFLKKMILVSLFLLSVQVFAQEQKSTNIKASIIWVDASGMNYSTTSKNERTREIIQKRFLPTIQGELVTEMRKKLNTKEIVELMQKLESITGKEISFIFFSRDDDGSTTIWLSGFDHFITLHKEHSRYANYVGDDLHEKVSIKLQYKIYELEKTGNVNDFTF
jgi:hypothetical protein